MLDLEDSRHREFNVETMPRGLDRARWLWDVGTQVSMEATLGASNKRNGRFTPDRGKLDRGQPCGRFLWSPAHPQKRSRATGVRGLMVGQRCHVVLPAKSRGRCGRSGVVMLNIFGSPPGAAVRRNGSLCLWRGPTFWCVCVARGACILVSLPVKKLRRLHTTKWRAWGPRALAFAAYGGHRPWGKERRRPVCPCHSGNMPALAYMPSGAFPIEFHPIAHGHRNGHQCFGREEGRTELVEHIASCCVLEDLRFEASSSKPSCANRIIWERGLR